MTTTIAMMPDLDDAERALVAAGRKVQAMRGYMARARVDLDGREHAPTLIGARRVVELAASALDGFPLAVSPELVFDMKEELAYQLAKRARFEMALREMRIPVDAPFERASTIGWCDQCDREGSVDAPLRGVYTLAPDANGWPTPVLFTCYECHGPLFVLPVDFDRGEG